MVVFFMPKTAYEMRMSDGSSDVCSSDLQRREERQRLAAHPRLDHRGLPFRRRPVQYRQVVHALGVHAIGLLVWPDGCALSGYLALQRLEKLDQRHAIGVAEAASDILMASVMIPADVGLELETGRSEEHTSELQSLMRISYAVFCLNKKKNTNNIY